MEQRYYSMQQKYDLIRNRDKIHLNRGTIRWNRSHCLIAFLPRRGRKDIRAVYTREITTGLHDTRTARIKYVKPRLS